MKFLVAKRGAGEGCDYTIGCNMRYDFVDFDGTAAELAAVLAEKAVFRGDPRGVCERERITLDGSEHNQVSELIVIPVEWAVAADLDKIRREHNAKVEELRKQDDESRGRKEFDRLRMKFGG